MEPKKLTETHQKIESSPIKAILITLLTKKIRLKEKRLYALECNWHKCLNWQVMQHEAMLLQTCYHHIQKGVREIQVEDWANDQQPKTILLDPLLSPADNIAQKYKQSKRLKRGIVAAEEAYHKQEEVIHNLRKHLEEVQCIENTVELQEIWNRYQTAPSKTVTDKAKPVVPYKVYTSNKGVVIWVGKGAKQNDEMTFKRAKGSDWWCHVEGSGGAHVIIKAAGKETEIDPETLQDAFQLALAHSSLRDSTYASVILTQCKNVRPMGKGHPGRVQVAKGKSYSIQKDAERVKALRNISV